MIFFSYRPECELMLPGDDEAVELGGQDVEPARPAQRATAAQAAGRRRCVRQQAGRGAAWSMTGDGPA